MEKDREKLAKRRKVKDKQSVSGGINWEGPDGKGYRLLIKLMGMYVSHLKAAEVRHVYPSHKGLFVKLK